MDSTTARRIKEKFRSDISDDIVRHLRPYMSGDCPVGRIQSKDDFRHLARKVFEAMTACLAFFQLNRHDTMVFNVFFRPLLSSS